MVASASGDVVESDRRSGSALGRTARHGQDPSELAERIFDWQREALSAQSMSELTFGALAESGVGADWQRGPLNPACETQRTFNEIGHPWRDALSAQSISELTFGALAETGVGADWQRGLLEPARETQRMFDEIGHPWRDALSVQSISELTFGALAETGVGADWQRGLLEPARETQRMFDEIGHPWRDALSVQSISELTFGALAETGVGADWQRGLLEPARETQRMFDEIGHPWRDALSARSSSELTFGALAETGVGADWQRGLLDPARETQRMFGALQRDQIDQFSKLQEVARITGPTTLVDVAVESAMDPWFDSLRMHADAKLSASLFEDPGLLGESSQFSRVRSTLWSPAELWDRSTAEDSTTDITIVHLPVTAVFDWSWFASQMQAFYGASMDRSYRVLSRVSAPEVCLRLLVETAPDTAAKAVIWVVRFVAELVQHH